MIKSGSEAQMTYKVQNLGESNVAPVQVAEQLQSFINSKNTNTINALNLLGKVKTSGSGCCTVSTESQQVVDKTETTTTTTTTTSTTTTRTTVVTTTDPSATPAPTP